MGRLFTFSNGKGWRRWEEPNGDGSRPREQEQVSRRSRLTPVGSSTALTREMRHQQEEQSVGNIIKTRRLFDPTTTSTIRVSGTWRVYSVRLKHGDDDPRRRWWCSLCRIFHCEIQDQQADHHPRHSKFPNGFVGITAYAYRYKYIAGSLGCYFSLPDRYHIESCWVGNSISKSVVKTTTNTRAVLYTLSLLHSWFLYSTSSQMTVSMICLSFCF